MNSRRAKAQRWINRANEPAVRKAIEGGRSILLLGPRQTGKSSLLKKFDYDFQISFLDRRQRLRYERDPQVLVDEVEAFGPGPKAGRRKTRLFIDEVQKVPEILDTLQLLIDDYGVQAIITGSSARKLRRHADLNLLPGRVVSMRMDPLSLSEWAPKRIEETLYYGSLPGVVTQPLSEREELLRSYVETYLEEEVRQEALVRRLDHFSRFLEMAAIDSGKISNFSEIARQVGVSHVTIASYYQILEDCLIVERVDPVTHSLSRRKITKSPKYLFFDLGLRRLAAAEGIDVVPERKGELFEQWTGLEIIRSLRAGRRKERLSFWRDPDGPEVDWVIRGSKEWIPVEAKWTERPTPAMAKNMKIFMREYPQARRGLLVCRVPRPVRLDAAILAIPWQHLALHARSQK